uniref:Saposin B-type domain-containing protein n=1 Tax=Panagrellus redivivus TaxID=6233 RepID=A0A7E4WBH8_PANRE
MKAFLLLSFVVLVAVSYSMAVDDTKGYEERGFFSADMRCKACKSAVSTGISGLLSRNKTIHAKAIHYCKKLPIVGKYCDKLGDMAMDKGMKVIQKKDRPLYMCKFVSLCKK